MSEAAKLYTPELLAATIRLAQYPLTDDLPLQGSARSKACGSTLTMGLATDANGHILRLGLRAQACAVGQASAALFAESAKGRTLDEIQATLTAMESWLAGEGGQPDWPGLDLIAPARDYPGRHGAMMLPWKAALEALSSSS